jgi:cytochrome c biogenesis protein CcmG/thiol:disulfide interchange protein DsbE
VAQLELYCAQLSAGVGPLGASVMAVPVTGISTMKPRRKMLGLTIAGAGLVLAGVALWSLLADDDALARGVDFSAVPAAVSFEAPSLTLPDLDGREHSLADYRGTVVLVNLWATWCPPCTAEMPILQRFYDQYREQGFVVIAINDGDPAAQVRSFVAEYGLTFPVWLDRAYDATERGFKTSSLPSSYVIDRTGQVRLAWFGAIKKQSLESAVAPIIRDD